MRSQIFAFLAAILFLSMLGLTLSPPADDGFDAGESVSATILNEIVAAIDALEAIVGYDDDYYCESYAGGDIGAQCNAAYAAMEGAGRGGRLIAPSGQFTQSAPIDFCDGDGTGDWVPVRFVLGMAGGLSDNSGHTHLIAGSGMASSAVADTFTITTAVDASNRDQIACAACDFRALGFRRNDLIEMADFAAAANNNGRASADSPLRVYRATATALIVEGETATDPGLSAVTEAATVRRLVAQIETCHFGQYVVGGHIDGDASNLYADIGIHHRPDNDPNAECSASSTPYSYCSGADAGSPGDNVICVNCGVQDSVLENHAYANIVAGSLEISGQSDNYVVERVTTSNAPIGIWWDLLQGKPGIAVRDSQLTNFYRNAFRQSSGGANLSSLTVISGHSDCDADTFGTCRYIEMLTSNTTQIALSHSEIEIKAGDGLYVGDQTGVERSVSLIGNTFYANDSDSSSMALVDVAGLCGTIQNSANLYRNGNTNAVAPTVTFSNSNQVTCPASISGTSSYRAGAGEVTPTLTVEDSIPSVVAQGGDFGAATATTASANDSDTSVATTAFVQGEINGAGGTDLTCSGGSCDVDSGVTRDTEWDSIGEIETATSADIVTSTETFEYTVSGSTPSGSCTTGDQWLHTAGPALYGCTSTDTWEAL